MNYLVRIIECISTILDEATFNATEKGLKVLSMDPSHLAMIDLKISGEVFDRYSCEGALSISVNVQDLLKFMRRGGEKLAISLDEEKKRLDLEFSIGEYKRSFTLSTLEEREEKTPIPRMSFDAVVKMPSSKLMEAIGDAKLVSEYVRFEADESGLAIRAEGDTMSTASVIGRTELQELNVEKKSKATYSVAYLGDIVRAGRNTSDNVRMEFSTDKPIMLDFEIPSGKLVYYLAPCIGV